MLFRSRFSVLSLSWTQRYTLFLLITLLSLVGVTLFLGVSGYLSHSFFQWWTHGSFCFLFLSLVPDWELFYHRSVYFHLNVVSFQQKYRGLAGVNSALWIVVSFSLLNCCLAMQGFGLFFAPNKNRP